MKLTISEFEKLSIAAQRNERGKCITSEDALALLRLSVDGQVVFKSGTNCIIAQQWVGVVYLQNLTVEILPKIAKSHSSQQVRQILLRMLLMAENISFKPSFTGSVGKSKCDFSLLLVLNLIEQIDKYLKKGLIGSYEKDEFISPVIKGRVDIRTFFQPVLPVRFRCFFSKYSQDNTINRILKYSLLLIYSDPHFAILKKRVRKILSSFTHVSSIAEKLPEHITFNSVNHRAKYAVNLAQLFIKRFALSNTIGEHQIKTFLLDMNRLYENFIFSCFKRIYKNSVHYQWTSKSFLSDSSNKEYIKLRPDIAYFDRKELIFIDTKWKLFKNFPSVSDVYQMAAYLTAYKEVKVAVLLFPFNVQPGRIEGFYRLNISSPIPKHIYVAFIDLTQIDSWDRFSHQLKQILQTAMLVGK